MGHHLAGGAYGRTLGAWLKEQPRRWLEVLQVMLAVGRGLVAAAAFRGLEPLRRWRATPSTS